MQPGRRGGARCLRFALLSCLLRVAPLPAGDGVTGESGGWTAVRQTPSGAIYHRDVGDSPVPMVMITARFDAAPAQVHAVVTDYDHFAEFVPNVAESRVLRREAGRQWVFHHLHFPGPMADRMYVFRSTTTRTQESGYRVEWQLAERPFSAAGRSSAVTPRRFAGFWTLRPTADGTATEARYAVHSEPGGRVPAWLVTRVTGRYVQQVVEAMRARLLHRAPAGKRESGSLYER